jgi:ankyrin repeat protein
MKRSGGRKEAVRMLVEMGSDVHARTLGGDTPLHWAESNGQEAVVIFLRNNAKNKQRVLSFGWCFGVFFAVVSAVLEQLGVFPPV